MNSEHDARVNFSMVLHERSDSRPVMHAIKAAAKVPSLSRSASHLRDGDPGLNVDAWLVPGLGYPDRVSSLLTSDAPILFIDRESDVSAVCTFFRAPARLVLPNDTCKTVGVAALIRRPGGKSLQIICRGPFAWTVERALALQTMEQLIQAHVDQWRPSARLWDHPAEEVLPEFGD